MRSWLTPPADEQFEAKVTDVCTLYQEAPVRAEAGERFVSTDELTGVQALERKHPGLPLAPGKVERREFEYLRHGTRSFILSRDIVTGQVIAPACGPTRADLRQTLFRNLSLRHEADYGRTTVTQLEAARALRRSRQFVDAVLGKDGSGS